MKNQKIKSGQLFISVSVFQRRIIMDIKTTKRFILFVPIILTILILFISYFDRLTADRSPNEEEVLGLH